jgi:hypothetical protein
MLFIMDEGLLEMGIYIIIFATGHLGSIYSFHHKVELMHSILCGGLVSCGWSNLLTCGRLRGCFRSGAAPWRVQPRIASQPQASSYLAVPFSTQT